MTHLDARRHRRMRFKWRSKHSAPSTFSIPFGIGEHGLRRGHRAPERAHPDNVDDAILGALGYGSRDLLELQFHCEIGECLGGGHHG
jgi:hypothetical protein